MGGPRHDPLSLMTGAEVNAEQAIGASSAAPETVI